MTASTLLWSRTRTTMTSENEKLRTLLADIRKHFYPEWRVTQSYDAALKERLDKALTVSKEDLQRQEAKSRDFVANYSTRFRLLKGGADAE